MSREAMKELVRARRKCTDENLGRWLPDYEKGALDESGRALFVEHLCECLHCMALYNIETKHKHGYIDPKRTRARRVKVGLLEWLPSGAHILAALSVWVVVVSVALWQTARLSLPKGNDLKGNALELRAERTGDARFSAWKEEKVITTPTSTPRPARRPPARSGDPELASAPPASTLPANAQPESTPPAQPKVEPVEVAAGAGCWDEGKPDKKAARKDKPAPAVVKGAGNKQELSRDGVKPEMTYPASGFSSVTAKKVYEEKYEQRRGKDEG